jgi:TIR domain
MAATARLSLNAFLSHRYRSPEVNIYFYNLFSQRADVYFDVDLGTVATNVTRLERMIRGCDAFIGIYPYPGEALIAPGYEELMKASRYFRLELDLAIRSRKPALVFYDRHYGGLLRSSRNIRFLDFNSAEIVGVARPPSEGGFRDTFEQFTETIAMSQAYGRSAEHSTPTDVGILLPTGGDDGNDGYTSQDLAAIREALSGQGYAKARVIPYPPRLDRDLFLLLEELDWVIVDVGDHQASSLVAYMHGQFIPTMRLLRVPPGGGSRSHLEDVLYGGIEVGYGKDIVRWSNVGELVEGLRSRLETLRQGRRYIRNPYEARDYFREASRRRKSLFLSYAREDGDLASQLAAILHDSFQEVFDYRDGRSLEPGESWKDQTDGEIAKCDLAVALLTPEYLDSPYCMEELDLIAHRWKAGELPFYPVKLRPDPLRLPSLLREIHYLRAWEYPDLESLAQRITEVFDEASTTAAAHGATAPSS